jgi:ribosomal protein L40E
MDLEFFKIVGIIVVVVLLGMGLFIYVHGERPDELFMDRYVDSPLTCEKCGGKNQRLVENCRYCGQKFKKENQ